MEGCNLKFGAQLRKGLVRLSEKMIEGMDLRQPHFEQRVLRDILQRCKILLAVSVGSKETTQDERSNLISLVAPFHGCKKHANYGMMHYTATASEDETTDVGKHYLHGSAYT